MHSCKRRSSPGWASASCRIPCRNEACLRRSHPIDPTRPRHQLTDWNRVKCQRPSLGPPRNPANTCHRQSAPCFPPAQRLCTCGFCVDQARHTLPAVVYRLRFKTADWLSLINRTVWLDPCTTISITPEIEYSLL